MKRLNLGVVAGLVAAGAFGMMGACDGDDDGSDDTDGTTPDAAVAVDAMPVVDADPAAPDADLTPQTFDVNADITVNTTWTYPDTYILKKHVFVKSGATLTIEPGVIVKGDAMSSLVITREGRISAAGTAELPIVFTSSKAAGMRAPGDWGGIVLLGKAVTNINVAGEAGIEGFPAGTAEVIYGGTDNAHDCGTLKYARVEFAGFVLEPGKELNGISVGACGNATQLDFIQIHKGNDDGIEFFGGSASVKHLLLSQGLDDGLDWDNGWSGKAQFVIVQIGDHPDSENGFEADNHATSFDLVPRSSPTIFNATIVGTGGAGNKRGMLLRRGTAGKIANVVVTNVLSVPIDVRDASTTVLFPGMLNVTNSNFFGHGAWVDATDNDGGFDESAQFTGGAQNNTAADPGLAAATSLTAPVFKPTAVMTGGATPPNDGFFDAAATFKGAIGADDWTLGWTAFPQN